MKSLRILLATFVAAVLFAGAAFAEPELKSPEAVKNALHMLHQAVGHTGRLVASKNFAQVGGEHRELTEGAAMLREAIATEPVELRTKVEPALQQAIDASTAMGEAGAAKDGDKLDAAHSIFAEKVRSVIELFPEDVRPKPKVQAK